jgi:hypothetical protein
MPHWKTLMNKEYVGHWDLEEKDATLTITDVKGGTVVSHNGKKDDVVIVHFKETPKKFISNTTNCTTIEALVDGKGKLYTPDYHNWPGKRITLYATTTSVGNKVVGCIRVRPEPPK